MIEVEGPPDAIDALLARLPAEAPPAAVIEGVERGARARARREGLRDRATARGRGRRTPRSRPTSRPARRACASSSTPPTAATATRSSTAPTAGRGFTIVRGVPVRPPADHDGRLHDVRRLRGRVRRPGEPPLPRPAQRLPRLRAASLAHARGGRLAAARGRHRGGQGDRRVPSGVPGERRGGGRAAAVAQAPRGEAVRADGPGPRGGARPGRARSGGDRAAARARPADRARPPPPRRARRAVGGAALRRARRDAPVQPAPSPAAGRRRRAAGDDERQRLRRADRLRGRRRARAARADRRPRRRPRPADRDPRRRLGAARGRRPAAAAAPLARRRSEPARAAACRPRRHVLACGAELKSTFCLARGRRAWVSHHIGDLKTAETLASFQEGVRHFERLFAVTPEVVAHDLHPDYLSTTYALARDGVEHVAVQHHHAHLAACLAEHGEQGPAVGAIFDGTGLGTDGTVWGGEILVGDLRGFERAGHLWPVPLPGGDQAVREPWRMACAWLKAAGDERPLPGSTPTRWRAVGRLAETGLAAPDHHLRGPAVRRRERALRRCAPRSPTRARRRWSSRPPAIRPSAARTSSTSSPACSTRGPRSSPPAATSRAGSTSASSPPASTTRSPTRRPTTARGWRATAGSTPWCSRAARSRTAACSSAPRARLAARRPARARARPAAAQRRRRIVRPGGGGRRPGGSLMDVLFQPVEALDAWLTSLIEGAPLLVALAIAFVLGLRHASDPDHLVAVSSLLAADDGNVRAATRLGAWWGVGHAVTLLVVGLPLIALKEELPAWLERGAETGVGLVILALGARVLVSGSAATTAPARIGITSTTTATCATATAARIAIGTCARPARPSASACCTAGRHQGPSSCCSSRRCLGSVEAGRGAGRLRPDVDRLDGASSPAPSRGCSPGRSSRRSTARCSFPPWEPSGWCSDSGTRASRSRAAGRTSRIATASCGGGPKLRAALLGGSRGGRRAHGLRDRRELWVPDVPLRPRLQRAAAAARRRAGAAGRAGRAGRERPGGGRPRPGGGAGS